ncbi:MAG: type II secretion system secretin GspD [Thermodesulfovibrionia bacterium]
MFKIKIVGTIVFIFLFSATGFSVETNNTSRLSGVIELKLLAMGEQPIGERPVAEPPEEDLGDERPAKESLVLPLIEKPVAEPFIKEPIVKPSNENSDVESPMEESLIADEPIIEERPISRRAPSPIIPPGPGKIDVSFPKSNSENYIILNFDNAALRDVIATISSITGENFILSPGVDARITIHSAGKIPISETLNVFESVLEVNNIGLVKSGRFYKIVPGSIIKKNPLEIQKGKKIAAIPYGDRFITQIVEVEYVPAAEISKVLSPMLSRFGSIIPNPRNNLLIINDTASNIKRLLEVLNEIDVNIFENTRMGFFQPKFSDVKNLSKEIKEILSGLNLVNQGVVVVPIERINSLVVFSSSTGLLRTVESWIKKLDEAVTTGRNIFIHPVQNVKAESIASVLKSIYGIEDSSKLTLKSKKVTSSSPAKKSPRRQTPKQPESVSRVEIVVFEPTNSLVILAPPGIFMEIKTIINELDLYPLEVLIEVIIAEVSLSDSDQFGIQWSVLNAGLAVGDDDFSELVQSRSRDAPSYTTPLTLGTGSATPSLTASGFSYLLFKPERLLAMLHALSSRGKVNILSSPRLLVRNHEEASIEVGSDIPTATSSTQTAVTTTATLTQNIEYKTVGIKLKITPSINDERTVVLDIEQEVSDQLPNVTVGQEGFSYPAFSTRKTKTSIVVPDKQTIVIGGIIKEKKDKNYQGIPILSSIPILGNLFRYTVDQRSKTELIIFLTPYVIATRTEADMLTTDFLGKLRDIKKFLDTTESQLNIPTPEEKTPPQSNEQ